MNRLSGPNSLPFHVYDYTPIPLLLEDDDLNTQTATLSISTIAGFFSITLSPRNRSLVWLDGNYGEGIDDNKLVARGSSGDQRVAADAALSCGVPFERHDGGEGSGGRVGGGVACGAGVQERGGECGVVAVLVGGVGRWRSCGVVLRDSVLQSVLLLWACESGGAEEGD